MSELNGKYRFLPFVMWYTVLLFFFYQFIARSSFPTVLTEQFMEYFRIDAAGMGVLASCYYWAYTLMQVPSGMIIDKVSVKTIATVATAISACGILLFVSTPNYYTAGFGQMLFGFGSSFAFILTLKIITIWFPASEVPVKTSYTMAIGGLGPFIGGPTVSYLVTKISWISLIKIFAIFGLFLSLIMWLVIRDKERLPVNKEEKKVSLMDSLGMILTSKQVWVLALFTTMLYAPLSALGDLWGVSFIRKAYNVDSTMAALANNMLYIGMVIGSPTFAYMAVFWNSYKKPMTLGISMAAICFGAVVFLPQLPIQAIFCLFFFTGFSCGAMLSYPLAMMIFPYSVGATVSGFINMASMVSGIILMPLIGYIINLSWDGTIENGIRVYSVNDYRLGLISVFVFLVIGIFLSLIVEDRSPRQQRK
ncbi:MAG: MFS transporter [Holosporaceae bacterium]|jgi:MFS family permease|nr:MFS transporter [Holosporaceae bacterium]